MSKRTHTWNRCDVCDTCGCCRIWGEHVGYWRFVWEDGRSVEPKGKGAPPCEGFSLSIVEACTTALYAAESGGPREKVLAVLAAYQDVTDSLALDRQGQRK